LERFTITEHVHNGIPCTGRVSNIRFAVQTQVWRATVVWRGSGVFERLEVEHADLQKLPAQAVAELRRRAEL
jgi:hypothetical protein